MIINRRKMIVGILISILIVISTLNISYAKDEEISVPKESVRLVDSNLKLIQSLRPVSASGYNFTNYQLSHTKQEIIERYNASRRVTTKDKYTQLFKTNAVFTNNNQKEATLSDQAIIDT